MNHQGIRGNFLAALALSATLVMPVPRSALAAGDPAAQVVLSSPVTTVGQPVRLTLSVTGSREVGGHPEIIVEGLQISPAGKNSQFQMRNFDVTVSVDLTYTILPLREGTFTIPAVEVVSGGRTLRTAPVDLTVTAGRAPAAPPGSTQRPSGDEPLEGSSDLVYSELIVPKTTAYVGETVPIEIRLYFDGRLRAGPETMPELDTGGFTFKPMPEPRREQRAIHGRPYNVFVFNTALTPLKAGALTIGPAKTDALVQSPAPRSRSQQSPFDAFESLFDDPFFGGAFQRMQTQRVTITSDPVELDVRDVPGEGRPASFDGAVGGFEMEVDVDLRQTSVGAPLTVRATIRGRGDFDRVNAPVLADPEGWRTYPPSSDFQADDTLGISGEKTFQLLVIPDEVKSELPPLEFSYFDPVIGEFRVLRSEPVPITVAQGATPVQALPGPGRAADPAPSVGVAPSAAAGPEDSPGAPGRDILHIQSGSRQWTGTMLPFYRTRGFWLLQAGAFVLLLAVVAAVVWRMRLSDARRLEALAARRNIDEARRKAASGAADEAARLRAAIDCIRLATAHAHGTPAPLVDAEAAIRARPNLPEDTARSIREMFARHDELAYAGAGGPSRASNISVTETLDALLDHDEKNSR